MILSLIVAIGKNGEIGKDNSLLWHLPEDMKNFVKLTKNKTVIMGRKTYDSIGKPLPNRENIVLTRNALFTADGIQVFHNVDSIRKHLVKNNVKEAVVMGGAGVYELFLPLVDTIYLSKVDWEGEADVYMPEIPMNDFEVTESTLHPATDKSPTWEFLELKRK